MKRINIVYWIFTGLLVVLMLYSGIENARVSQPSIQMLHDHLGYPTYIIAFLGVAKILGSLALLVPGFPRLKEWIYAGFVFDLTGAIYSSISSGDTVAMWAPIIVGYIIIALSYIYHHKRLKATALLKPSLR